MSRIVFLVGTLQTGGIERLVTNYCLYLKAHTNWEPVVICLLKRTGPFLETLESERIRVEECRLQELGFVFRLGGILRSLNPKVVHSQVAFSMPWQVLGILVSGSRKIIFTQQNEYRNWDGFISNFRLRLYFFLFFRFIRHYTCVSEQVRSSLCKLIGKRQTDFIVIPNCVDTHVFHPDLNERVIQRKLIIEEEPAFLVGMVARFSEQKGHKYLVKAARILKDRQEPLKIILIGRGELVREVEKQVMEEDVTENFLFHGQATNIDKLIQSMDCFILPSLWEGMPLALLEAMACGLPVVGTDVSGTREVIEDGYNGLLIPSKHEHAIADALTKLKHDSLLRQTLGTNARAFVLKKYSLEANMAEYLKLYE
ncbi:MAG: glycosyltransferase family 4 protein [Cyclobacteriaceae bacterium]|jgi:glycosyltransferase involved in cell wall biosynthesis